MSVRVPQIWNGMYLGNMNPTQAETIMSIRQTREIEALKNWLLDLPYDLIVESMEKAIRPRELIAQKGLKLQDFVSETRWYQTTGTAFMYMSPRSMLGDGVGLGKTAELAALINYLRSKRELRRFLISVENSALGQTTLELMRFTGLRIVALPSEATKLKKVLQKLDWSNVDGAVMKHSALRSDLMSHWLSLQIGEDGMCRPFNMFVLDESSVIKNDGSKIYDYTRNICNIMPRVHFLNATAFDTSILDIYWQMDMMYPDLMHKKTRIQDMFCSYNAKQYWIKQNGQALQKSSFKLAGYKNEDEFRLLLQLVYFARSKKDVGKDRPPIARVYEVQPTEYQMLAINKGYRYQEVLNCPSIIPDIQIPTDSKHVPKLARLVSLVENEFNDSSVMVYCFHTDAQYRIASELQELGRKVAIINGSVKDDDRYRIQREFNEGKYDVIITNIRKSLNLNGADVLIIYSAETVPSRLEQICGRIDRNVDDKIKTFIALLYSGTAEYDTWITTAAQRAKDSKNLTIDADMYIDYLLADMLV